MLKFNQNTKRGLNLPKALAVFGLACSLFTCNLASAQTDSDFRAPPPVRKALIFATLAVDNDFRAPATDGIVTSSINKPKFCGRATFLNCRKIKH